MKRVYIAIALAITMLFGSTTFAGSKSANMQVDSNFMKVNSYGHHRRGKQYHRWPQHRQHRRMAPRRIIRHVPRYRYAPRRHIRAMPRHIYKHGRHFKRPARHHYKRYMPRNRWHQKRRARRH